jgi:signal transduction histidine kinase
MHQVLMNLCSNAAHAMQKDGGVLNVKLLNVQLDVEDLSQYPNLTAGPYVRLAVSDTGCGIEEDIKERIFEPFFTTKGPAEGTGMGLAVVHGIVNGHRGAITVYSEPGKGTTFHVLLPRMESAMPVEDKRIEPLLTGSERILLVDDEQALVNMGERMSTRF